MILLISSTIRAQQPPPYFTLTDRERLIVDRLLIDLSNSPVVPSLWLSNFSEIIPELQITFNIDYETARISSINLYSIALQYFINLNSIQYSDYELQSTLNYYDWWINHYNSIINDPNSTSVLISQALLYRGLIVSLRNFWPSGTYMY